MARRILACPTFSFRVASLGVSAGTQETSRFPRAFLFRIRTCPKNISLVRKVNGVQKRGEARVGAKRVVDRAHLQRGEGSRVFRDGFFKL